MKNARVDRKTVLTMPIEEFFDPNRVSGKGHAIRTALILFSTVQKWQRKSKKDPSFCPLYGIQKLETVSDMCQLDAETLRSMPGIGETLERLIIRLLAAEGVSLKGV